MQGSVIIPSAHCHSLVNITACSLSELKIAFSSLGGISISCQFGLSKLTIISDV